MSDTIPMKAPKRVAPAPSEPAKQPQAEPFHPHERHNPRIIQPPSTGVTHIDPGVVTFSP